MSDNQIKEYEEIRTKFDIIDGYKSLSNYDKAQAVIDLGYAKEKRIRKETAEKILRELWFGSVFTYTNINGCGEQCENLIIQFDNCIKEIAKEYGVELDNE